VDWWVCLWRRRLIECQYLWWHPQALEGMGVAATMDYDVPCMNFANFASAKTMRSGSIGNSCRPLFRSKLREAIKYHYADSRRAWAVSGVKELQRRLDI
jgi:hypothetical protein